jgi:hypothetical protein
VRKHQSGRIVRHGERIVRRVRFVDRIFQRLVRQLLRERLVGR